MRKKVLIALYAYKPFENANTNVILPLISELEKQYEVHIASLNVNNSANYSDEYENIHVFRYKKAGKIKRIFLQLFYTDPSKTRTGVKSFFLSIGNMISSMLFSLGILRHNEYKLLKKLIRNNDYSFIISTCESFVSCLNVLMLKKKKKFNCPWIVYFMDPFAKYIENLGSAKYWKQELEIYENADLVLVTEEIYDQNKQDEYSKYLYKTRPVKFCNFVIPSLTDIDEIQLRNNGETINCVYAGSLINDKIRDPSYLFKIINSLHGNYVFHLVLYRLPKERLQRYKKMLSDSANVIWYDTLPLDKTKMIICNSDILNNIGNKVINQTPSKVFDYIATRKPIVNIISIPNDTSIKYLKDYPLCLNILEDNEKVKENAHIFDHFCKVSKGKRVSTTQLIQNYYLYDQQKTVQQIMYEINKIID